MEHDSKSFLVTRYCIERKPENVIAMFEASDAETLRIALHDRFGEVELNEV